MHRQRAAFRSIPTAATWELKCPSWVVDRLSQGKADDLFVLRLTRHALGRGTVQIAVALFTVQVSPRNPASDRILT